MEMWRFSETILIILLVSVIWTTNFGSVSFLSNHVNSFLQIKSIILLIIIFKNCLKLNYKNVYYFNLNRFNFKAFI